MESGERFDEWTERSKIGTPNDFLPLYNAAINAYGLLGEIAGEIGEFRVEVKEGAPFVDALMALGAIERTTAVAMDELADALGVVAE